MAAIPCCPKPQISAYADTPLLRQCPAIQQLLAQLQCPLHAVRLMNMQSGAYIKPHRDHDLCFEQGEVRLHFPVFTNSEVVFYAAGTPLHMQAGECWYVNVHQTHSVVNNGSTSRIHLVADCGVNDWVKNWFAAAPLAHQVADTVNTGELLAIIAALRLQRTETSMALAQQLEQQLHQSPIF
ncbi:aspartyl/asparaginyl beta-hydroxylase domain-containing protein [Deminuibacter soli]|uniref:aspartyl/asparaginyl beta-hydroxylase domain-containing protein n=1 Tax=Deminuibacter soli TaxID=2291815 RepID=UPI001314F3F8|nr:aspartyl/asparaginyl beta-hydroxylase domain-containing protein [Deminuibacter soli]